MVSGATGVDYSQPYITPMNAKSHAGLPKAILVTAGFDMLRDVAHHYAQKLAKAGNDITYVHYPDLSHAFIQMTAHSKRCLEATQEVAQLLGKALQKVEAAPFNRTALRRRRDEFELGRHLRRCANAKRRCGSVYRLDKWRTRHIRLWPVADAHPETRFF